MTGASVRTCKTIVDSTSSFPKKKPDSTHSTSKQTPLQKRTHLDDRRNQSFLPQLAALQNQVP